MEGHFCRRTLWLSRHLNLYGFAPRNDVDQYWCIDDKNQPSHGPVRTTMARDRWKQISQAFQISEKGQSVFLKVFLGSPYSFLCNLLTKYTGRAFELFYSEPVP
jgi:hypothetical protein